MSRPKGSKNKPKVQEIKEEQKVTEEKLETQCEPIKT